MNYADYKAFVLRTLQRDGDTVLEVDLDELIRGAEAKLTRDLRSLQTVFTDEPLVVLDQTSDLPSAVRRVTLLRDAPAGATLRITSPDTMATLQSRDYQTPVQFYSIVGRKLRLAGPLPRTLYMDYVAKVPSYQDTDAQPYRDDGVYTDLYDAAVLAETPMYLRDDERVGNWVNLYNQKIESANNDNDRVEWGSAPLGSMLPEGIM